jgi:hypothetical protein
MAMATSYGDSGDGIPRPSYGVLGSGVPWSFTDQDGNTQVVNATGVFGVTGGRSDISDAMDDIDNNFVMPMNAAVAGVLPQSTPTTLTYLAIGFLAGKNPFATDLPMGAYGQSDHTGVAGIANNANGVGVYGGSMNGVAPGVLGETMGAIGVTGRANAASGEGVRGENTHGGLAGHFVGNVRVDGNSEAQGDLRVTGNIEVDGDVFLKDSGDVAETFEAVTECRPGTLMIISASGMVEPCSSEYDKRVVGVVSGAGPLRPGLTLGGNTRHDLAAPISMLGRVFCLADASKDPIELGDLLTSSSATGHAMKAADPAKSFGAVIGKALEPLEHGRGLIPILIALR